MIDETPYDLRWRMFGISCRVHPLFWLVAFILSYPLLTLGLPWVIGGVGCVFFSILLHELGHVIVGNIFGSRGHIVLWAFGGLAIGSSELNNRWKRIAVFIAGPAIQLLFWAGLYFGLPYLPLPADIGLARGIIVLLAFLLTINLFWPILNLLPIWPLDGGQISRELFRWGSPQNGIRLSLHLSMGIAGLLALHAIVAETSGRSVPYLPVGIQSALFFAYFAVMSFQTLQLENARDQWSDDHWR
jgi:Zn-dependent protease